MSLDHMLWAARQAGPIDPIARLVLMMLAAHSNVDGRAWPSIPTLAAETGLHAGTVRKAIRRLEAAELVKTGYRLGKTPEYVFPDPAPRTRPPAPRTRGPRALGASPRAQDAPKGLEGELKELSARLRHPALGLWTEDS